MAIYIDDTGGYEYDAELLTTKGTDFDYNATTKLLWFSTTGTATTGFTLPDSEWVVFEVYEPNGYTQATTGYDNLTVSGVIVRGHTEYTTNVNATVLTTLNAWLTAFEAATAFTSFKVKATHYHSTDTADVYETTKDVDFTTATKTNGSFTGHGSGWILSDTLLADSVSGLGTELFADFECDSAGAGVPCLGLNIGTNSASINGGVRYLVYTQNGEDLYTDAFNGVINGSITAGDKIHLSILIDASAISADVTVWDADGIGSRVLLATITGNTTETINITYTATYSSPVIEFDSSAWSPVYIDKFTVKKEI